MHHELTSFFKSFGYAGNGIQIAFGQRNMKVHSLISIIVIIFSGLLNLSNLEWAAIIFSICFVFATEIINTAIEEVANLLRDQNHLAYKDTKNIRDLAAGAVLLSAISAALIGFYILGPKLLTTIGRMQFSG
jgi:diacylglycerol kinase